MATHEDVPPDPVNKGGGVGGGGDCLSSAPGHLAMYENSQHQPDEASGSVTDGCSLWPRPVIRCHNPYDLAPAKHICLCTKKKSQEVMGTNRRFDLCGGFHAKREACFLVLC